MNNAHAIFTAMHAPAIAFEQDRLAARSVPCLFHGCTNTDLAIWVDIDDSGEDLQLLAWEDGAICQAHGELLAAAMADAGAGSADVGRILTPEHNEYQPGSYGLEQRR